MTEREALLAAIVASPDDDLPRLVFADWLEEQAEDLSCKKCGGTGQVRFARSVKMWGGLKQVKERGKVACDYCEGTGRVSDSQRERAEFIRLHVGLARLPNGDHRQLAAHVESCECGRCSAPRRAFRLLKRNAALWLAESPLRFLPVADVHWTRGFVGKVDCSLEFWLDDGDEVRREQPVAAVRLMGDGMEAYRRLPVQRGKRRNRRAAIAKALAVRWEGVEFDTASLYVDFYGRLPRPTFPIGSG